MRNMLLFVALTGALCLNCLLPGDLLADYYSYKDGRGVVNITNKIGSVPAKYRSTMKIVKEDPKPAPAAAQQQEQQSPAEAGQPAPADAQSAPAEAAAQQPGRFALLFERFVWLKPLLYLAGVLALFVATIKLTSQIASPLLSKLILLSFFLGVFVFLYKSYVTHVVESSTKIKNTAVSIIKKANVREETVPEGEAPAAQR